MLLSSAAIAVTPVIDEIHVGVDLFVVVPSPTWPNWLLPQAQTVPESVSTTEWAHPAAAAGPAEATDTGPPRHHVVKINRPIACFIIIINSCAHTFGDASAFGQGNSTAGATRG